MSKKQFHPEADNLANAIIKHVEDSYLGLPGEPQNNLVWAVISMDGGGIKGLPDDQQLVDDARGILHLRLQKLRDKDFMIDLAIMVPTVAIGTILINWITGGFYGMIFGVVFGAFYGFRWSRTSRRRK